MEEGGKGYVVHEDFSFFLLFQSFFFHFSALFVLVRSWWLFSVFGHFPSCLKSQNVYGMATFDNKYCSQCCPFFVYCQ